MPSLAVNFYLLYQLKKKCGLSPKCDITCLNLMHTKGFRASVVYWHKRELLCVFNDIVDGGKRVFITKCFWRGSKFFTKNVVWIFSDNQVCANGLVRVGHKAGSGDNQGRRRSVQFWSECRSHRHDHNRQCCAFEQRLPMPAGTRKQARWQGRFCLQYGAQ